MVALGLLGACGGESSCPGSVSCGTSSSTEALDVEACSSGECGARQLADNPYCGVECQRLEELSQGCLGSHTEQDCVACGTTYVRIGGNDASTLFYDATGTLVTVQVMGEGGAAAPCEDAWFGIDLSRCVARGAVRRVYCDSPGP
jgi:hypothetical protein